MNWGVQMNKGTNTDKPRLSYSALRRLLLYAREEARRNGNSVLPFLLDMAVLEVCQIIHKQKGAAETCAFNGAKHTTTPEHDAGAKKLLNMSSAEALSRWDDLLQLQVDVFFAHELDLLYAFEPWRHAASVLDAGCGNGYYLAKLQTFFPEKSYLGIDVSPELIARAADRWQRAGLTFSAINFFDFGPECAFDLILMRFIAQHLNDLSAILDQAARVLQPGGGLLIVEPDRTQSENVPRTPFFDTLFQAYEGQCATHGLLRSRLSDLAESMGKAPGWSVNEMSVSVPQVGPFSGSKLFTLYSRWIELCEESGVLDYPYQQARQEISAWAKREDAFSKITLRAIYLKRTEDSRVSTAA
jgi:SAM-dependent methyltransferase